MLSIILSALLVAFASHSFRKFTTRVSPNIPYAGGESILSRLKVPVEYALDPVGFLSQQWLKLGNVFCVDLFLVKLVFVLGSDGNRVVFRANEDDLSFWDGIRWAFGPKMSAGLDLPGWLGASMKTVKTGFLNQERLSAYKLDTAHIAAEHFDKWCQEDSIPLFQSMSRIILGHLLVMILGEKFYRQYGDELIPMMRQFERDLQHPLLRLLPGALWDLSVPGRRISRSIARFEELVNIESHEIFTHPDKHHTRTDYLSYVCEINGTEFAPAYGSHLMSIVFAGHANAAMTLPWMFLHARRTPGALARWRDELALGADAKKPFLDACLRETGRLYTNLTVMRRARVATVVEGHALARGTMVACSPLATQRDPAVFKDPLVWKPERFLEDGAYAEWFQKAQFVQFGLGQHACPGEKLLRMMIFDILLKPWLESYDIEVVGGLREGQVGIDGVGVEGAWTGDNFGTPFVKGDDVRIKVSKRLAI